MFACNQRNLIVFCQAFFLFAICFPPIMVAQEDEKKFPTEFQWGKLVTTDQSVELHINSIPEDRKISIPRFNNSYQRVFIKSDAEKKNVPFKPGIHQWHLNLPKDCKAGCIVIMETVGKPRLLTRPYLNLPNTKGEYNLPAHHAIVHGKLLRFEPQPHKNTIGYWANEKDWCEWKIKFSKPGRYHVDILQGCGKGQGGSKVEIQCNDSQFTFTVIDTGHFQNFKERRVGTLEIKKAGVHSLKIQPIKKARNAVMDVRQVQLIPER